MSERYCQTRRSLPPYIFIGIFFIMAILNIGNVEEFCDSFCHFIFTVNRDEKIAHKYISFKIILTRS